MNAETVIGIDPGISGGCAIITPGGAVSVFDIPTIELPGTKTIKRRVEASALAARLDRVFEQSVSQCFAVVEAVGVMGGSQNMQFAMASLMRSLGAIEAALEIVGIPFEWVRPADWKRFYGLAKHDKETPASFKARSMDIARSLYPADTFIDGSIARAKDHNLAESLLIAHYGLSNARQK